MKNKIKVVYVETKNYGYRVVNNLVVKLENGFNFTFELEDWESKRVIENLKMSHDYYLYLNKVEDTLFYGLASEYENIETIILNKMS